MKFRQWIESPLSYYGHEFKTQNPEADWNNKGFGTETGYFIKRDRNGIKHPLTFQRLETVLNRSPFKFNILMIEEPHSGDYNQNDTRSESSYRAMIQDYLTQNKIPYQDRITFAKNGSSGDPLTPWMILHNIGHAILDGKTLTLIHSIIADFFMTHAMSHNTTVPYVTTNNGRDMKNIVYFMKRFLQFKSAQSPKPLSVQEMSFEMFADYLWHGGRLRFNVPTDGNLIQSNPDSLDKVKQLSQGPVKIEKSEIEGFVQSIESIFQRRLQQSVGKVIMDHLGPSDL